MAGFKTAAIRGLVLIACLVACDAASAAVTQLGADYNNVRAWSETVAKILNSGECISYADYQRLDEQYNDALRALIDDARAAGIAVPKNDRPDTGKLSGWPFKVAYQIKIYNDLTDELWKRICRPNFTGRDPDTGEERGSSIQILFPKTETTVGILERSHATGAVTNSFNLSEDPIGVGLGYSYAFAPWNNAFRVVPFGSFEYLHQTINQTFTGGNYLGTTTHWIGTLGGKLGVVTMPGVFLYGLTGASFLSETMNIELGGPFTSQNVTVPGYTLGLGAQFTPVGFQLFSHRLSLFLQYQHTWWQDAHLTTPAASPLFDYTFHRGDDTVRLELSISLENFVSSAAPARPTATR